MRESIDWVSVMTEMVESVSMAEKYEVARNPEAPAFLLEALWEQPRTREFENLCWALACNPATPTKVIVAIVERGPERHRQDTPFTAALKHPNCPEWARVAAHMNKM